METSKTSAVLDIVTENRTLPSSCKDLWENGRSGNSLESSLAPSPSIDSFSTLADTEAISELNMDENSDLCVKVDNPQKYLDTLETVITFRITTKVARIEFEENQYVVRRRYNEFVWLRNKLIENHPFCIVPPLPGKHGLMEQLDRYSKDFILNRMNSLNVFMVRITKHPILSCSGHFKVFITSNHSEFLLYRKQCSTIARLSNANQINRRTWRATNSSRNTEFEKARDYLVCASGKLSTIEKISTRINKERQEFTTELQAFFPIFYDWSLSEPELSPVLQSVSGAIEKVALAQTVLTSNYQVTLAEPVKELLVYVDVVRDTLHRRQVYQNVYENSAEELARIRTEKDQILATQGLTQNPSRFSLWRQTSCDEKLEKLGTRIPQLVKRVEQNQDNLECANECLRADLERWQKEKQQSIVKVLLDFVNQQITFHEKCVAAWDTVVSELATQKSYHNTAKK